MLNCVCLDLCRISSTKIWRSRKQSISYWRRSARTYPAATRGTPEYPWRSRRKAERNWPQICCLWCEIYRGACSFASMNERCHFLSSCHWHLSVATTFLRKRSSKKACKHKTATEKNQNKENTKCKAWMNSIHRTKHWNYPIHCYWKFEIFTLVAIFQYQCFRVRFDQCLDDTLSVVHCFVACTPF